MTMPEVMMIELVVSHVKLARYCLDAGVYRAIPADRS